MWNGGLVNGGGTGAWWGARWDSIGRNRIARSEQGPIGSVAADRDAGADYAGHAESCGCSNKKVTD